MRLGMRSNGARHPPACVGSQIALVRPGLHGTLPHQAFNPVKARVEAFSQNIVPDAPCSVGPVTGRESLSHDRQQMQV